MPREKSQKRVEAREVRIDELQQMDPMVMLHKPIRLPVYLWLFVEKAAFNSDGPESVSASSVIRKIIDKEEKRSKR